MKKNFFQRLQRVKLSDLFHVFLFLIALIPSFIYKIANKPFWLICDYGNEARDNGYYFYKYMIQKQPEQKVIYAINKKSPDYQKVCSLGDTVQYGSLMHWILYLAAEINISSQKGGKPNAAICYVLEVYNILRNKRAFLQHGIIKDNLPYVHYKNARFSMFTVSTQKEFDYVNNHFGYPEGIVKKVGLCRFDELYDESDDSTILVMPTWRQWISNGASKTKAIEDISSFENTEYYKAWYSLLNSEQLNALLKQHNKKLVFYPHRNMQQYINYFDGIKSENIEIACWPDYDVHDLLKKASLLITDYSSVAMDFAYLNKPIIYYQFDYNRFRENHMEEGYFSYENHGFGPICDTEDKVIASIEKNINSNFKIDELYLERINDFFDMRDKNNCERTYKEILKLKG